MALPAYQRYASAIGELPASIEALCASPDQARLEAAQEAWRGAMLAWQHAQPINFGPVADLGLAPQIEFWPDKHGTAGRQYSQALAGRDASLLDPDQLADKSVGLTSLVTLERLLFDDGCWIRRTAAGPAPMRWRSPGIRSIWRTALAQAWSAPDGFGATVVERGYRERRVLQRLRSGSRASTAASPTRWTA